MEHAEYRKVLNRINELDYLNKALKRQIKNNEKELDKLHEDVIEYNQEQREMAISECNHECETCRYAHWDYEDYYGTNRKQWFVDDCELGIDIDKGE